MTDQFTQMHSGNVFAGFSVAQHAFRGVEDLVRLNLAFVKQALPHSDAARQLAEQNPLDWWLAQANNVQPAAQKLLEHNRQASEIALRTHAAILDVFDAGYQQQQAKLRDVVEGLAKNAPAGSEAAVSVLKSAVSFGSVSLDTIRKSAAQAIAMAQQAQPAASAVAQPG